MKAIGPVRTAMGVRTVFNILGPLSNPAEPPFHVIGAFNEATARLMAQALSGLPLQRAFVVHGAGGWDEPTPLGPFLLLDVWPGRVEEFAPQSGRLRHGPLHRGRTAGRAMPPTTRPHSRACCAAKNVARIAMRWC